jgi:hypothetical protein
LPKLEMEPDNQFRRWTINAKLWGSIAAVALLLHVWWAISVRSGAPIARCGALWVLLGLIVVGRQILRQWPITWHEYILYGDAWPTSPPAEEGPRKAYFEERWQRLLDAKSNQMLGPLLILFGTALWGYGDLIWSVMFGV